MPKRNLNAATVANARPRSKPYKLHDKKLKGFVLRVWPNGRKSFRIETRCDYDSDVAYETIGDATKMPCDAAREIARNKIASVKNTGYDSTTPFDVMAELAFRQHKRLWKPRTMQTNQGYLRRVLIPYFTGRAIGSITRRDVEQWFTGLADAPGTANRSLPVLSVIMRTAEDMGCIPDGSNPARNFRRYKTKPKERFLSNEEMARLGAALRSKVRQYPMEVAIIRLLLLTGARKGEIESLQWKFLRDGNLYLPDSKTGPKTIFLSERAKRILTRMKKRDPKWVFPCKRGNEDGFMNCAFFWNHLRIEIGLEDVRLHDLRHTYASVAIRNGENLRVVGMLLGHVEAETTLRYVHLDDGAMHDAVEKITTSMLPARKTIRARAIRKEAAE